MALCTSGKISDKHFIVAILAVLLLVVHVDGVCNVCSATTELACVSPNSFAVCDGGRPIAQTPFTCPNGKVCSTVGNIICQPNVTETATACKECGTCDASNSFACTSTTDFVLCLGNGPNEAYKGSCATGTVCSIEYPYICGNPNDPNISVAATCPASANEDVTPPTEETPTDTELPPPEPTVPVDINNPTPYCQAIQQKGRFPVGTNPASTCRQYVQCFLHGTTMLGASYVCPGNNYFNCSSQLCGPNLPARCSSTIRSLSLASFDLN